MEQKQPDEDKKDDPPKKEGDQKEGTPRSNPAQRDTLLTKKIIKGLLGIVFFRHPIVPPGCPNSPNRLPLPPPPCGLRAPAPMGWPHAAPRRAARAAPTRYRCRSPPALALSRRPQFRRPGLPNATPQLIWPSRTRGCVRCRESVGSRVSRGTSTDAAPATSTVGTTMEPEICAGPGSAGHESQVLDSSGFWVPPPFAIPPAPVGAPPPHQTGSTGARTEGPAWPIPQREGIQRSRANTRSWPGGPLHCQDSVRSPSQKNCGAPRRRSRESRVSGEATSGSERHSGGSMRSNHAREGSPEATTDGRPRGTRFSAMDQNRRVEATKDRRLELSPVSYVVFVAALVLTVFYIYVAMFMPENVFLGMPRDAGGSRQHAVAVATTTVLTANETDPLPPVTTDMLKRTARRKTRRRRT
ncbi:uncharacterized protein [Dermacentor albipictus]|uniref:uncharacterized protein isoform X1 n=1 Tax=Dermacentor albipictus TaxID=60249 RepID=UPI0038FCC334